MRRLGNLSSDDLVEGVDALAGRVESEHEMHDGGYSIVIFGVDCIDPVVFEGCNRRLAQIPISGVESQAKKMRKLLGNAKIYHVQV